MGKMAAESKSDPDFFPSFDEPADHPRAGVGLSRSRWTLYRENAPIKVASNPKRRAKRVFVLFPNCLTANARSFTEQERSTGQEGPSAFDPVIRDIFTETEQGARLFFAIVVHKRKDRVRVDAGGFAGLLDVNRPVIIIDGHGTADRVSASCSQTLPAAQVCVLLHEAVAVRGDAPCSLIDGIDESQA